MILYTKHGEGVRPESKRWLRELGTQCEKHLQTRGIFIYVSTLNLYAASIATTCPMMGISPSQVNL